MPQWARTYDVDPDTGTVTGFDGRTLNGRTINTGRIWQEAV